MFPIGDASRQPKHVPVVTASIIGLNILAFILELAGGPAFIRRWSLVPANITAGQDWITL